MPFPAGTLIVQAADPARAALTLWCRDPQDRNLAAPGLLTAGFGQGKAVYVPADLGKSAFFCNFAYVDHLLADALRWAAKAPPLVEVAAPRTVISVPQQRFDVAQRGEPVEPPCAPTTSRPSAAR